MLDKHLKNKHLTYEERTFIEIGLNQGRNFKNIAKDINKDRTTVAKEIKLHKFRKVPSKFNNYTNLCKNKYKCKKFDCTNKLSCYEDDICPKLLQTPYVCNDCQNKSKCKKVKYYYYAKFANDEYTDILSSSRIGIYLSQSEIYEIDNLVSPLIKDKNQSIAHIFANHPDEISFSRTTLYTYINMGILSCKNIDLVRKVKYRVRRKNENKRKRRETVIRENRKMEDFNKYIEIHPGCPIVEMDTVEGKKGGKVLLTLLFRKSRFMLIYLMEKKNMECVEKVFKSIKILIGIETFKKAFGVILTDNGSEFFNPISIEIDNKEKISNVFYCNPGASWQKGSIEKNHEYIRYVLPKGTSFDNLKQEDVDILKNNINSYSRDSLNGKSPYDEIKTIFTETQLVALNVNKIKADDVNLSTKLLKQGDK